MNVLVLIGSTRSGSFNAALASAATDHLPGGTSVTTWARLGELPFYDEELDASGPGAVVEEFRAVLAGADALIVATPEYNGSVSGLLKNAVDWASRPRGAAPIAGLPVAVIGASASPNAAQWAREHLVRILTVAGASPLSQTVGIGSAHTELASGTLSNADVDAALRELVGRLSDTRRIAA